MKKLVLLLLFVMLVACSKKESTDVAPTPSVTVVSPIPLPAPEATKTFTGSTWSLTLPHGFEPQKATNPTMEGLFANQKDKVLISVVKEPFIGSDQNYSFLQIQLLKVNGIPTSNPIVLNFNGQSTTLVEGTDDADDIHVWIWMTTKGGFGYTLSCGGIGDPAQHRAVCSGLFSEFKID